MLPKTGLEVVSVNHLGGPVLPECAADATVGNATTNGCWLTDEPALCEQIGLTTVPSQADYDQAIVFYFCTLG